MFVCGESEHHICHFPLAVLSPFAAVHHGRLHADFRRRTRKYNFFLFTQKLLLLSGFDVLFI